MNGFDDFDTSINCEEFEGEAEYMAQMAFEREVDAYIADHEDDLAFMESLGY